MVDKIKIATIGALLHDVGKVCIRAGGERKTHQILGSDFLRPFCEEAEAGKEILRCVRYHHGKDLSGAHLASDDLSYVVYEADNLAAGLDRRDSGNGERTFDWKLSLENVFNVFEGVSEKSYYPLKVLDAAEPVNYPVSLRPEASCGAYAGIEEQLRKNFAARSPADMEVNELLRILEDTLSYVPSSTAVNEACDISLYDHVKITAATAAALLRYMENHGITDYKDFCYTHGKDHRKAQTLLFISGDFSGIQKFIYRVEAKGAMRMLRGRSFYLQMVMENAIDEILEKLSLSRANLIYSGGGHFYMLADNSGVTKGILEESFAEINRRLLLAYGTSLYLAGGWTALAAEELLGNEDGKENIFRRVGEGVSEKKQRRYAEMAVRLLSDENSELNAIHPGMRECALCHRTVYEDELSPYKAPAGDEGAIEVCDACNGMYTLGRDLIDQKKFFAILDTEEEGSLAIPSACGERYLKAITPKEGKTLLREGHILRIYSKNASDTSEIVATRLWVGDYAAEEDGEVLDFAELAERAGGAEEEKSIRRLGVLRADVDWLGAVFAAGLPKHYATLSRYAALSRNVSLFFAKAVSDICQKKLPKGQAPFYLFGNKDKERLIHVVYAGGDDLFLVGAWDDLLETAMDMRRAFRGYTDGSLSFSAGLGLYSPTYPILHMAEETGDLEDRAKKTRPTVKDSLALFGEGVTNGGKTLLPVFRWQDFEEKVWKEKVGFLASHFILEGINEKEPSYGKIRAGKSLLYRLLGLLTAPTFNLARFAYTLARLSPEGRSEDIEEKRKTYNEIRTQFFQWGRKDIEERLQLETALRLVIYRMREK